MSNSNCITKTKPIANPGIYSTNSIIGCFLARNVEYLPKTSWQEVKVIPSPFNDKNIFNQITEKLDTNTRLSLRSVNRHLNRMLPELLLCFHPMMLDFFDNTPHNEDLIFAKESNLGLKIESIESHKTVQILIDFIENPNNESLLKRIKSIEFGDINKKNINEIQYLFKLFETKKDLLKNLNSLSCKGIGSNNDSVAIELSGLKNLRSFSCECLMSGSSLKIYGMESISSFSCIILSHSAHLSLQDFKTLDSFYCRPLGGRFMINARSNFESPSNTIFSKQNSGMLSTLTFNLCMDENKVKEMLSKFQNQNKQWNEVQFLEY